jgi:hypothetical protein
MLQERDSYRSQVNTYEKDFTATSPVVLNSQQQQQRSRIVALEKTVEGYRGLVERFEGDLDKTMKGSGNHIHPKYVVGPLLVPGILDLNNATLSIYVSQFLAM